MARPKFYQSAEQHYMSKNVEGVYDGQENQIGKTGITWPKIINNWVLFDYYDPEPNPAKGARYLTWCYPVNGIVNGDTGYLFFDAVDKFPFNFTERQFRQVKKWVKAGKGFCVGINEKEKPVIQEFIIPAELKREFTSLKDYQKS